MLALANDNSATEGRENRKHGLSGLVNAQKEFLDPDEIEYFAIESQGNRKEVFVTEPGLYRVISQDRSRAAKKFQRWVFHEVLPSIRKYGTYPPPLAEGSSDLSSLAQLLAQNTNLLVQEIQAREKLALETRLRFERTEAELGKIIEKMELLGDQSYEGTYFSAHQYCDKEKIEGVDQQLLRAMCVKICLEKNVRSKKQYLENGESIGLYPPYVIQEAIRLIKSSPT